MTYVSPPFCTGCCTKHAMPGRTVCSTCAATLATTTPPPPPPLVTRPPEPVVTQPARPIRSFFNRFVTLVPTISLSSSALVPAPACSDAGDDSEVAGPMHAPGLEACASTTDQTNAPVPVGFIDAPATSSTNDDGPAVGSHDEAVLEAGRTA